MRYVIVQSSRSTPSTPSPFEPPGSTVVIGQGLDQREALHLRQQLLHMTNWSKGR